MPTHSIIAEDVAAVLARTRSLWPELKNATVFITGATGFFGIWLQHLKAGGIRSLVSACVAVAASLLPVVSRCEPTPPALSMARPEREICVRSKGALGNGQADDTAAIQSALDEPNVVVRFPGGTYLISKTLRIHSGGWIDAEKDAVIRLADDAGRSAESFLLTNAEPERGDHSIVIEGGVWDGNNQGNPRKREYHGHSYGGVALNFTNTRQLIVRNLTIRNPEAFSLRLGETEDFLIENITFDQSAPRPNQDGVHIGGFCRRGIVRSLRVSSLSGTHDDMVAINADDDVKRPFNVGMRCGPISDILVTDLEARDAYTFVRLLSHEHAISQVVIDGIRGGCRTNLINADRWRFPVGGGCLNDITVRNVTAHKTGEKPDPLILIQSGADRFVLENICRDEATPQRSCTLLLDNGRINHIRMRSSSEEPGPAGATNHAATEHRTLTIADGGIAFMSISRPEKSKADK